MYIFCHLTYVPVTIIGNTVYSKIIAGTVLSQGLPYRLCRTNNRLTVYETSNHKYVAFEGVPNISSNEKLPIITCSTDELQELEAHTGLNNLKDAQVSVLQDFDKINGMYSTSINNIIGDVMYNEPIMNMDKLTANLYYISTATESWLTPLIITDTVEPLEVGDTIVGFISSIANNTSITEENTNDSILITTDDTTTKLTRRALFYVEDDLSIVAYPISKPQACKQSLIYGLREPRPFLQTGIRIVHPFHLPLMWDPLLSMMLVTTAIITQ